MREAAGRQWGTGPLKEVCCTCVSSETMIAVHFDKPGGPENLYLKEVAKPSPGEGEVLLKVAASALNRADLLQVPRGLAAAGTEQGNTVFNKHSPDR